MPTSIPVPSHPAGDVFTESMWQQSIRDNINKLLDRGHRVLTVAQFGALTSPEGTKGTVAPDEVYLEVDAANGILWHLAYESGETTYKWRFLSGPPLLSEVTTAEATASMTYVALTTAGPSVALPRAGDYDIETGIRKTAGAPGAIMSIDIGATGAVDADLVAAGMPLGSGSTSGGNASRKRRKTGLTSVTLTAKYRAETSASVTIGDRSMALTPVRLRHDA